MIDQLQEKYGIKMEELNALEKETFLKMLEDLSKSQITPEKMRDYVHAMKESVEKELVLEPEFNYIFIFRVINRKQILLKARLLNYLLFESFLLSPEKAKVQLEQALSNVQRK